MLSNSEKKKLSRGDSLTIFNCKKKLDFVLHNYRKSAYRRVNEKRRTKTFAKSCDKSREKSAKSEIQSHSFFLSKPTVYHPDKLSLQYFDNGFKNVRGSVLSHKNSVEIPKEKASSLFESGEILEKESEKILDSIKLDGEEAENVVKLKEIIYKLQLRDAVHRQKILKLQNFNAELQRNCEKLMSENSRFQELRRQETKNSQSHLASLENAKKKIASLENKLEKLDPFETARLLEKLHQKNEELTKENKKLEEMVKQLLLNREISRIRKLYPTMVENIPMVSAGKTSVQNSSPEKEREESRVLVNGQTNYENPKTFKVKNVCLDLKEMLKGL